jgi:hypothetical protein
VSHGNSTDIIASLWLRDLAAQPLQRVPRSDDGHNFFTLIGGRIMTSRSLALLFAASTCIACGGDDGPTAPSLPFTVSGTVVVRNGTTIPSNARVLVLWGVSATDPDYSYVYGTGTVTPAGTFSITFDAEPPAAALNNGQLGVGLVILTTDQTLAQGQVPASYTYPGVIGMTADYSIIFTKNLSAGAPTWASRFAGYGVGLVERSTTDFDSFKVTSSTSLQLIVDDLSKLHAPNWT